MNQDEVIKNVEIEAKKYFEGLPPSHNWSHVESVYGLALKIGREENADLFVLSLAALLHDIGRKEEFIKNGEICHAEYGKELAEKILGKYKVSNEITQKVLHCIETHRFRKDLVPESKEAKILFDADKLDCIGAIGVIRAYAWVGEKNIALYSDKNFLGTGYEKEHSPVTEFNFKLSKVKDRLFTDTGKKIAKHRHNFMVNFFDEMKRELEI